MSDDILLALRNIAGSRGWLEGEANKSVESLVSVVIPHYNNGPYIEECLLSAAHQTWPNLEIIVVDDHSDPEHYDALSKAFAKVLALGKSAQLLRLPKRCGTAWAQNIGYYLTSGGMICNLDSDDLMEDHKVARQVEHLLREGLTAVGTSYRRFRERKGDLTLQDAGTWIGKTPGEITSAYQLNKHKICWGTVLMKRCVVDLLGGNTKRYVGAEDFEIAKRIVDAGWRMGNILEPLYWYRDHPGQRSKLFHS